MQSQQNQFCHIFITTEGGVASNWGLLISPDKLYTSRLNRNWSKPHIWRRYGGVARRKTWVRTKEWKETDAFHWSFSIHLKIYHLAAHLSDHEANEAVETTRNTGFSQTMPTLTRRKALRRTRRLHSYYFYENPQRWEIIVISVLSKKIMISIIQKSAGLVCVWVWRQAGLSEQLTTHHAINYWGTPHLPPLAC